MAVEFVFKFLKSFFFMSRSLTCFDCEGKVPDIFHGLSNIKWLNLFSNKLTGTR